MNRKVIKARLVFIIGLFIFMFDLYVFFQPAARVQAQSNVQPTSNVVATDDSNSKPAQAPATAADNSQPATDAPVAPTQNAPTSVPAQATDVPAKTNVPTTAPTQVAPAAKSTDNPVAVSASDTPQDRPTVQPTESTTVPTDVPATSEATAEPTSIPAEATSEATQESTVEVENTQEPTLTDTRIVAPSKASPESTSEATSQVKPLAALAVQAAAVAEPDVELGVTCPSPGVASFTLRNNGGAMLTAGQYIVSNPASSQSFQLGAGQSISFQAAGDATVSAHYTTASGTQVSLGATGQCASQPTATATLTPTPRDTLTPSNTPLPTATFTPSSTPTTTLTPTITLTPSITPTPTITLTPSITPTPSMTFTPSNTPLPTATFTPSNTPLPTATFTPSNTPTITLTPSITPTPTITLTPSITPTASATSTLQPGTPLIELSVACLPVAPGTTPQARFRLRDVGGDMLKSGTYTLQEPNKPAVQQAFLLMFGQTQDLIAAGNARVDVDYSTIIFSSVSLGVTGTCLNTPTLTPSPTTRPVATNTPRPPATSVPATSIPATAIPTVVPTAIPVATNTPAPIATSIQGLSSNNGGGTGTSTGGAGASAQNAVSSNAPGACGEANETLDNGFPVIDMGATGCVPQATTLERPAWTSVSMGGAVCPDWLIYHTNMTGNWEIFRLGNLPNGVQADPNLSRGVGRRVYDIMPSRSPDQMWIAFATNRDTNWEIYISAVEKDDIQRVTYTPDAVELDPVWSPVDGRIVYESNRDGNWNLYMFNVSTGTEKQLTDGKGNDINANWSPDGKHIVYQSDEQGFWQIYELDMATLKIQGLSDAIGDDHGPQFSHDGKQIVFHSFRQGTNSVLYIMNADGSHVASISDPSGNAINPAWSPDDHYIAYQSNVDGDQDVYVYELSTGLTRKLTDNGINDYAPTWMCNAPVVAFTSDITGDSNIFSANALPIKGQPINVKQDANQLTSDTASDQYPVDSPPQESASRQDSLPSPVKNK